MKIPEDRSSMSCSRRNFLKAMGGGLMVILAPASVLKAMEPRRGPVRQSAPSGDVNVYLHIAEDGKVTCFAGKVELGQGAMTVLAMMLAEELDVSLASVEMVMGDTARCPFDMGTFGSMTVKYFGPTLRAAGAKARAILIDMAAEKWNVPAAQLDANNGQVIDRKNPDRRITYGNLTRGKIIEKPVTGTPQTKKSIDFKIMGKPQKRTDAVLKVTGEAKYTGDILFPDMLYARVLRPPAHGARLVSVNADKVSQIPDVRVIRDKAVFAVLHPSPDMADKALELVEAKWEFQDLPLDSRNIYDHLMRNAPQGVVIQQKGEVLPGESSGSRVLEGKYYNQYVAHAAMETHTATAKIEHGNLTIWASSQNPFGLGEEIVRTLRYSTDERVVPDKVRIITPFVGGAFGGKTNSDQAIEATRLAWLSGRTVQVCWTRAEEFFLDRFRPASVVAIRSGVDESKKITSWDFKVYYAGERSSQNFYDIPNVKVTSYGGWGGTESPLGSRLSDITHPFGVGAWRAPGSNTNVFAMESHMDVLAEACGMDPLEFRLLNLRDPRMRHVLETAAKAFGWSAAKAPSGRGQGVACGIYNGTYVAAMAEIAWDEKTGRIAVKRIVCVQDMGLVVNPAGAKAQMEGCMVMGLGYALTEEVHFKGRRVLDINFDTYDLPRFSWVPKIETILIDNPDMAPQEGGEPPIIVVGAVIANALFDASGRRVCELPLTPERIRAVSTSG